MNLAPETARGRLSLRLLRLIWIFALAVGLLSPTSADARGSSSNKSAGTRTSHSVHVSRSSQPVHVRGYTKKDAPRTSTGTIHSTGAIHVVTDPKTGRQTFTNATAAPIAAAARPASPTVSKVSAPPARTTAGSIVVARDDKGRIQRSAAARHAFARQTGYPNGRPGYVVDHIKPLACGGADAPANMQWQTIAAGKAKDKVERIGC